MKKSTKGAMAASAAGVLLLGGAGSLAYWTATGTAEGGSITAGDLKLTGGKCDVDWVYATKSANAGKTVTLFVPGDKITKQCTFALEASGDNLAAILSTPKTVTYKADPAAKSLVLEAGATYAIVDGTNPRTIASGETVTSADDGATITARFDVTVPHGTDEKGEPIVNGNDTQDVKATLDALTVTLTQVDPNAAPVVP